MPNLAMSPRCGPRCIASRLPYAVGISSHLTVFATRPRLRQRRTRSRRGPARARRWRMVDAPRVPLAVRAVARGLPAAAWRSITWRNGTQPRRRARFAAVRVTPAHEWRHGHLAPEVWLLCEEETGRDTAPQALLRASARRRPSLRALVALAHQRWAIEQQYQELKANSGSIISKGAPIPAGSTMSC